jgi:hypothetical protein
MTLAKPDFSNLPKFEKNFYLVRAVLTLFISDECICCIHACWIWLHSSLACC